MGTDCAPVVANLFLFAYEYEFMKGLLKDNITLAIKFSNTYRYIDDLLCINNKDFELSISDIYPKELILKKTNTSPKKSPFLDLDKPLLTINLSLKYLISERTLTLI